jgi:2-oxoisovalerate dehydrogenase E1 component beta subunit
LEKACDMALSKHGIQCKLIGLQTVVLWDVERLQQRAQRMGKLPASHEAPVTCGSGVSGRDGARTMVLLNPASVWL